MNQFETLKREVQQQYPNSRVDLQLFDSGAAILTAITDGKMVNFEFLPQSGYGVVEVKEEEPFSIHYDFMSQDFQSARANLLETLHYVPEKVFLAA